MRRLVFLLGFAFFAMVVFSPFAFIEPYHTSLFVDVHHSSSPHYSHIVNDTFENEELPLLSSENLDQTTERMIQNSFEEYSRNEIRNEWSYESGICNNYLLICNKYKSFLTIPSGESYSNIDHASGQLSIIEWEGEEFLFHVVRYEYRPTVFDARYIPRKIIIFLSLLPIFIYSRYSNISEKHFIVSVLSISVVGLLQPYAFMLIGLGSQNVAGLTIFLSVSFIVISNLIEIASGSG